MNIAELEKIGNSILDLLSQYHNPPQTELLLDAILFAHFTGQSIPISRQHYVYMYGSQKPHRIDFRVGGNNPAVIEFACRPATGGGQLYGSQNTSELRKLCKVSQTQARIRVLLLLDLSNHPIERDALKDTYDSISAGRGRFRRSAVRVIYIHATRTYNFLWNPFRA